MVCDGGEFAGSIHGGGVRCGEFQRDGGFIAWLRLIFKVVSRYRQPRG